ncbi:bifunctional adenosylcobinamide kinase/adenosylcobinamide-phosphate guanylyltransferase [Granulicella sibirica]|uniref:bifunctional adenosylcobinamide kinase/adenosylcobinamide-phosphate guanylyltransferase n=1 Tax=Granulicella sibirica TaxID=2479048 RepID=UPI001008CCB8|nr:bifunctional adenosylcobinamide kinase/adenosylcobinamide-phosphate guanylyltransferase [Granulicella sibirica]
MQDSSSHNRQGSVTLVLGGVRSGKSRYAQRLAGHLDEGRTPVVFVATASAVDDEMRRKIDRHREDRPTHWRTIEEPLELARVITETEADILLIDCLTIFAASLMDAGTEDVRDATEPRIEALIEALANAPCRVILVSNEVGSGVVPAYPMGRRYRDLLGEINQRVARIADDVILMVAGLPLALKGHIEVMG